MNPKWAAHYKKDPERFSCHRVQDIDIKQLLAVLP